MYYVPCSWLSTFDELSNLYNNHGRQAQLAPSFCTKGTILREMK